nr:retrovirus-related Pol polyprotein from transposon TNT 1-94 [Tanacetum cinerariifolium]
MTIVRARDTIGNQVVQKSRIQCFNCKEYGHFMKEYRKPKRVKDYEYHKEKMMLCKLESKEPEDEHVLLASLISNFKLDVDENKKSQKQLKKANTFLTHELEKSKQNLEKSKQDLEISKQDLSYCKSELEKYNFFQTNYKDKEKAKLECAKALGSLKETKRLHNESSKTQSYTTFCVKNENVKLVNQISAHENMLIPLAQDTKSNASFFETRLKTKMFAYLKDLVQGNIMIKMVYYVKGLNHNLFMVGQLCDVDLEVAFKKSACFVRDLQGNDLLTGNRGSDLHTISLEETSSPTQICFMAKPSPTQAWLWHRKHYHLNFETINLLSKKDIVNGLPKLKYVED